MSLAFVEPIGRAIEDDCVSGLASAVASLVAYGSFEEPSLYPPPHPERYARRLIWRDPHDRFVIVGMTWTRGQSAPLHDHGGVWGVEVVARGTMCETPYTAVECDAALGRTRFRRGSPRIGTTGAMGVLDPPFDYHTFGNAGDEPAHTLHVYAGSFASIRRFAPEDGDWYREANVRLAYD